MIQVKVCGITERDDAEAALDAGADAIGLNFVPGTTGKNQPLGAKKAKISAREVPASQRRTPVSLSKARNLERPVVFST